jgi:glycosyltransferase involved in cell wall biosynthesis
MKIYFNRRPVGGPWGGGSKILSAVIDVCLEKGHQVFFEEEIFSQEDIDVIVCMDPRSTQTVTFNHLLDYKNKHRSKIVQRIGDLGTHGKPELLELLKATTPHADLLIFPSNWAKKYLNPPSEKKCSIILNATSIDFFSQDFSRYYDYNKNVISVVTHHWSNNHNKGFEIYQAFDEYCSTSNKFKFTYIGRTPPGVRFSNHLPPMDTIGLLEELPKHHVYLTASKNEAGANHVLEAMALNLPVLYHSEGGSIVEYCKNYGFVYENTEELIYILENSIDLIRDAFVSLNQRKTKFSKEMAEEYVALFESLI